MKNKIYLFIILFILCHSLKAQLVLDSIKYSLKQKSHLFAKLDNRNSFIDNNAVNIFGAKIGLSFNKNLSFGIGYYQLYNPPKNFNKDILYVNSIGNQYIITTGLKMSYFSVNAEYTFHKTNHWELSMPLQIGLGRTYYQYTIEGVKHINNKNFNFIYEPTIAIDYKIIKWVGLSAAFGYRFMITESGKLNSRFTSPIITFGVAIYYSEILKSFLPKLKRKYF
jgi:hypothetical protein